MSDTIIPDSTAQSTINSITQEIRDVMNNRRNELAAYPAIFLFQNVLANLLMEMFIDMTLPGHELPAYEEFNKQFKEAFLKQLSKKALNT